MIKMLRELFASIIGTAFFTLVLSNFKESENIIKRLSRFKYLMLPNVNKILGIRIILNVLVCATSFATSLAAITIYTKNLNIINDFFMYTLILTVGLQTINVVLNTRYMQTLNEQQKLAYIHALKSCMP